jgi:hypothetical protein
MFIRSCSGVEFALGTRRSLPAGIISPGSTTTGGACVQLMRSAIFHCRGQ